MSTARELQEHEEDLPEIIELSEEEARVLLDKEARELLGMSGEEFRHRWLAGEFRDQIERDDIWRVSFYLGGDYFRG